MVHVRSVSVHEKKYFYLFYAEHGEKYKRYIGMQEPQQQQLDSLKAQFLDDIKNHPHMFKRGSQNAIQLLQDIQAKEGFVSEENIIKTSKELDVPAVDLYGVLTFYSQFKLKPPGKHTVQICNGTACHVRRSQDMQKQAESTLTLKTGDSNEMCSLESVNCIGACARAPAMMVDGTVQGELTKEKVKQVLEKLQ